MTTKTTKTAATKVAYSLNSIAAKLDVSPKTVRAKLRRTPAKARPFDHTKVDTSALTAAQAKALTEFMKTDNRVRD